MLKNVVLPAPFGPIRLEMLRSSMWKSTSSTATRPPNSLRNLVTSSSAISCRDRPCRTGACPARPRRTPLTRYQTLRSEEHHHHENHAEDPEFVERHVQMRSEVVVRPAADVCKALAVEVAEEARAEDDARDAAHPAEDDHAEDEDRDVEEEVVGERRRLVAR